MAEKEFCTEAVVVSMVAAEAETSTVSTLAPTSSLTLVVEVLFRTTSTARIRPSESGAVHRNRIASGRRFARWYCRWR
jgi:hypothetical protein